MSIEPPITDVTPDTAAIVVPRRSRRGLPVLTMLLAFAAIAAGVLTRMIPGLPARSPARSAAQLPEEIVVEGLAAQAEAKALEHVVLQLDDWNQCPWPDCTLPWGHVPEFTLFDDGRVVYMDDDPADFSRWIVAASMLSPEDIALLVDRFDPLILDRMPQVVEGDPCPAAGGCPGGLIVRVRQDGVLRTFHGGEGTSADAWSALLSVSEPLRKWSGEANTALPQTMVAMPSRFPDEWHSDGPPPTWVPTWVGPATADLPALVDREMVNRYAMSSTQIQPISGMTATAATDGMGEGVPSPFAHLQDVAIQRPSGWYFQTFDHGMPTVESSRTSSSETGDLSLVFVPWIYPDIDVAPMVEVFREASRNAVAARAAADATAIAALPSEVAVTSESHPPIVTPSPMTTRFPTAPAVTWTDGRAKLPAGRGIQTWMQWYRYDEDRAALTRLRQAGFEWFKQRYAWADLQPTGSQGFDASSSDLYIQTVNDLGGRVIIQLAVPPPAWAKDGSGFNEAAWGNFVTAFAERYKDKVDAYEIMNEPNLAREWGGPPNPSAYAGILRMAYASIKAWDPNGVVITAGLAPTADRMPEAMGDVTFLRAMLDASANHFEGAPDSWPIGLFDAIGVHAAGFKAAPDVSPDDAAASAELGGDRTFTFRRIEDLWEEAGRNGDADQPLPRAPFVITEFGWTTDPRPDSPYHWMAVDAATRGQHIAQAFAMGPTLLGGEGNVGPMILFSAADRAWTPDEEAFWWAVADADGHVDGAAREALGLGGE